MGTLTWWATAIGCSALTTGLMVVCEEHAAASAMAVITALVVASAVLALVWGAA